MSYDVLSLGKALKLLKGLLGGGTNYDTLTLFLFGGLAGGIIMTSTADKHVWASE